MVLLELARSVAKFVGIAGERCIYQDDIDAITIELEGWRYTMYLFAIAVIKPAYISLQKTAYLLKDRFLDILSAPYSPNSPLLVTNVIE